MFETYFLFAHLSFIQTYGIAVKAYELGLVTVEKPSGFVYRQPPGAYPNNAPRASDFASYQSLQNTSQAS